MTGDADEIWSKRDELAHIQTAARARMAGPWATLAVVLAATIAQVPPRVTLPPLIGGASAPNLFAALVGPSGAGKGAATACGYAAIEYVDHNDRAIPHITPVPIGTGEGIARTYRPWTDDPDDDQIVESAVFSVAEIDTLSALLGRSGATLDATLRSMWSGEALGHANSGRDTRLIVDALSYRAALIAGVQPLRAGALLDAADGGLPQRFMWASTSDPDAPDSPPDWPEAWTVRLPKWQAGPVPIPGTAVTEIRAHRLAVLRGRDADPLGGHRYQSRLRVAVALMALGGRTVVSDQDWEIAGTVMDESDRVRAEVIDVRADARRQANRARGRDADGRDEAAGDRRLRRAVSAVRRAVARGPIRITDVAQTMRSDIRAEMGPALAQLLAAGEVVETPDGMIHAADTRQDASYRPAQVTADIRRPITRPARPIRAVQDG